MVSLKQHENIFLQHNKLFLITIHTENNFFFKLTTIFALFAILATQPL